MKIKYSLLVARLLLSPQNTRSSHLSINGSIVFILFMSSNTINSYIIIDILSNDCRITVDCIRLPIRNSSWNLPALILLQTPSMIIHINSSTWQNLITRRYSLYALFFMTVKSYYDVPIFKCLLSFCLAIFRYRQPKLIHFISADVESFQMGKSFLNYKKYIGT